MRSIVRLFLNNNKKNNTCYNAIFIFTQVAFRNIYYNVKYALISNKYYTIIYLLAGKYAVILT